MPKEKSAGAIVFRLENKDAFYLLLHYPPSAKEKKEYWDLPKGHIEQGESEEETVRREVAEETGLDDLRLFHPFREIIHYWFQSEGRKISKTVVFYLAQTKQKKIVLSPEHVGFGWFSYEKALEKLTYENARQVLRKARQSLREQSIM